MPDRETYWFPAKRYGWGWGLPSSWQGWAVLAAFAALSAAAFFAFSPNDKPGALFACIAVLTALLIAICWLKGEPPRWRWGDD
ncbi:MAG TPA: hypothetical protein VNU96_10170 [Burkholderiales bacterium]|nr:hypothetical protein [Burkholderiales bacterium]